MLLCFFSKRCTAIIELSFDGRKLGKHQVDTTEAYIRNARPRPILHVNIQDMRTGGVTPLNGTCVTHSISSKFWRLNLFDTHYVTHVQ